MEMKVRQKIW